MLRDRKSLKNLREPRSFLPELGHTESSFWSGINSIGENMGNVEFKTKLGHWIWNLYSDKMFASPEVFSICGLKEQGPEMDIELFWDLIHPADDKNFMESLKKVVEGHKKVSVDYRIIRPDGTVRYVNSEMILITDSMGKPCQIFATDQDITERKEVEERYRALTEELRMIDRRKNEFLGILSHEIRNPLASITLCLSLLDRVDPGGERARQIREIMGRQVNQLSRLVDDLLDVTRINRNVIVLQKEQLDLNVLVLRTVDDYRYMFQEKGVELTVNQAPGTLYVEADPVRLSQVVGNLLHNAVKFTAAGGYTRVTVSRDQARHRAVISVKDNGIGLSPQMLPNLFQTFMQADHSLDHSSGGLGLGLALVKGLTELHGGSVGAYSDGPGQGSTFTIELPLVETSEQAYGEQVHSCQSCRSRRILIIEDMKDIAEVLRMLLEKEGHQVAVAHDGVTGIALAKKFLPEILLCDIGLPGMNGYQVAQAFAADPDLQNVYLVSLTGYARPEDVQKASEAGFHCHLTKPVDLEKLNETLNGLSA